MPDEEQLRFAKPYTLNPLVIQWVESFATCAIEGNSLATDMINLWNNNRQDEFVRRLEDEWLKKN